MGPAITLILIVVEGTKTDCPHTSNVTIIPRKNQNNIVQLWVFAAVWDQSAQVLVLLKENLKEGESDCNTKIKVPDSG